MLTLAGYIGLQAPSPSPACARFAYAAAVSVPSAGNSLSQKLKNKNCVT